MEAFNKKKDQMIEIWYNYAHTYKKYTCIFILLFTGRDQEFELGYTNTQNHNNIEMSDILEAGKEGKIFLIFFGRLRHSCIVFIFYVLNACLLSIAEILLILFKKEHSSHILLSIQWDYIFFCFCQYFTDNNVDHNFGCGF